MIQAPLRIVFLDAATFGDVSLDRFKASWDCTIHPLSGQSEIPGRLDGYQAAVINKVRLNRSVLEMSTTSELRLIVVAATGTDNVDLDGARARGIKVCNVPGYASHSVARFTMSLILELSTHVGRYSQVVRAGAWQKSPMFTRLDFPSVELYAKKIRDHRLRQHRPFSSRDGPGLRDGGVGIDTPRLSRAHTREPPRLNRSTRP